MYRERKEQNMLNKIFPYPSGNALTRQVARAKHAVIVEKTNLGFERLGTSGLAACGGAILLKAIEHPIHIGALLAGAIITSVMTADRKALNTAIQNCKSLKASSNYQKIVARAKQIYK